MDWISLVIHPGYPVNPVQTFQKKKVLPACSTKVTKVFWEQAVVLGFVSLRGERCAESNLRNWSDRNLALAKRLGPEN